MADGRSSGSLGESFSPTVRPLGCERKVTVDYSTIIPRTGRIYSLICFLQHGDIGCSPDTPSIICKVTAAI
ncbi:unnamed protein product [Pleuronectes platessa]|uniref:Uncharacterized protein n=1 Tax=Pleuronectes platessa TaxID=8262 RepID=A0A9N7VPX1_PLEPL|nr:unnamed protein product [Pleuronectes platessa]